VKIFDDGEKYYALLMERVGVLMKQESRSTTSRRK